MRECQFRSNWNFLKFWSKRALQLEDEIAFCFICLISTLDRIANTNRLNYYLKDNNPIAPVIWKQRKGKLPKMLIPLSRVLETTSLRMRIFLSKFFPNRASFKSSSRWSFRFSIQPLQRSPNTTQFLSCPIKGLFCHFAFVFAFIHNHHFRFSMHAHVFIQYFKHDFHSIAFYSRVVQYWSDQAH